VAEVEEAAHRGGAAVEVGLHREGDRVVVEEDVGGEAVGIERHRRTQRVRAEVDGGVRSVVAEEGAVELDGAVGPGAEVIVEVAARQRRTHDVAQGADRVVEELGGDRRRVVGEDAGKVRALLGAVGEDHLIEVVQLEVEREVGSAVREVRLELAGRLGDAHSTGELTWLGGDAEGDLRGAAGVAHDEAEGHGVRVIGEDAQGERVGRAEQRRDRLGNRAGGRRPPELPAFDQPDGGQAGRQ
jgi:hypothetical protein